VAPSTVTCGRTLAPGISRIRKVGLLGLKRQFESAKQNSQADPELIHARDLAQQGPNLPLGKTRFLPKTCIIGTTKTFSGRK